jgi:predicted kinase
MSKLYVLVGVPGSGKSTWVHNQKWVDECVYVSTDEFVEDYAKECNLTYSEVFQDYMPRAVELMVERVLWAKALGKDIIWDQTSTTIKTRAKKLRMLPDYYAIAVVFKTPQSAELQRRLTSRPGKIIPQDVVDSMTLQLINEPPSIEEGFKEIWYAE